MIAGLAAQLVNGLAGASTLFLIAVGLSLIFGVTRIVNFAHGSVCMIGLYVACSVAERLGAGPAGFWGAVALAALAGGLLGAAIELLVLRRIYRAPELLQLLATFAVVLILRDATLWLWGPEDLLGPKAPGMKGAVQLFGRAVPEYELFLIAVGPIVLGLLWLLLHRTRFGVLVRAATQDREMVAALGVDQKRLFTAILVLGSALAGLGGALQMPREPASLALDLSTIGDAFVVVVVGGLGSLGGAFLAALLVATAKALCHGVGTIDLFGTSFAFSRLTLVVEFLVMAAVLIWRPQGLLGRVGAEARSVRADEPPVRPMGRAATVWTLGLLAVTALVPVLASGAPYLTVLLIDVLIAILFATSLHFIVGPAGLHSFGHAAYFGLGAYGAALLVKGAALPMEIALILAPLAALAGAALFGAFAVRLSGVYLSMLTLAFAQIVWGVVFQWDEFTGGSNGLVGVWPSERFSAKTAYFYLCLASVAAGVFLLRRMLLAPLGYAMRAARDAPMRAEATGIDVARVRWAAFVVAGLFCGLAGALHAFAKGSISPEAISVARSVDGLVMVLLGGLQSLAGPVVGAAAFTVLQDEILRATDYWRALLGGVILLLVLAFPGGLVGGITDALRRWRTAGGAP